MTEPTYDESVWQQALGWVLREHEQPMDAAARAELQAWLEQDTAHRQAYEKARYIWLLTGLVPPSTPGGPDR